MPEENRTLTSGVAESLPPRLNRGGVARDDQIWFCDIHRSFFCQFVCHCSISPPRHLNKYSLYTCFVTCSCNSYNHIFIKLFTLCMNQASPARSACSGSTTLQP